MSRVVNLVSRDLCDLVAQVRGATGLMSTPGEVERLIDAAFEAGITAAKATGMTRERVLEILYPFVALVDEAVLRGPVDLRDYWRSRMLQTRVYSENRAGERFFVRLGSLLDSGLGDKELVYAYLIALSLGFEGQYHGKDGHELLALRRKLSAQVVEDCDEQELHDPPRVNRPPYLRRREKVVAGAFLLACLALHVAVIKRYQGQLEQVTAHINNTRSVMIESARVSDEWSENGEASLSRSLQVDVPSLSPKSAHAGKHIYR